MYGPDSASCYIWYTHAESHEGDNHFWYSVDSVLDAVEVGLTAGVCCVSFVICTVKLATSSPTETAKRRNKRAAVTVTIFTGLFLVCNMPYFINRVLETITVNFYSYPGPIFSHTFMYWYSWTLSKVFLTVVNAVLNPVVYYYSVTGFKGWMSNLF